VVWRERKYRKPPIVATRIAATVIKAQTSGKPDIASFLASEENW